jgi:hypothetical protein
MEAVHQQHMQYLIAKSAEKTLNRTLRWMTEAPVSDLLYTVALLQQAVTRIEAIIVLAESIGGTDTTLEQQKMWQQIRMVVRSIKERLADHQQNACGTMLSRAEIRAFHHCTNIYTEKEERKET